MVSSSRYTKEALEVSAKLLEVNPEVYTAWNYRKLAVQSVLESISDPEEIKSVVDEELELYVWSLVVFAGMVVKGGIFFLF